MRIGERAVEKKAPSTLSHRRAGEGCCRPVRQKSAGDEIGSYSVPGTFRISEIIQCIPVLVLRASAGDLPDLLQIGGEFCALRRSMTGGSRTRLELSCPKLELHPDLPGSAHPLKIEAVEILGEQRVAEIKCAKRALAED